MPKALSRWRSNVIQPLGPPLRRLARLGHLISGKTSKCTTNVALLRPALLRVPGRVWNLEGSRRRERTAAKTGSGCNSFVELSRSYRVGGSRNSLKSQQFCCRDNLPNGTLHTRVSKKSLHKFLPMKHWWFQLKMYQKRLIRTCKPQRQPSHTTG